MPLNTDKSGVAIDGLTTLGTIRVFRGDHE